MTLQSDATTLDYAKLAAATLTSGLGCGEKIGTKRGQVYEENAALEVVPTMIGPRKSQLICKGSNIVPPLTPPSRTPSRDEGLDRETSTLFTESQENCFVT
jgi:hypothetical protein